MRKCMMLSGMLLIAACGDSVEPEPELTPAAVRISPTTAALVEFGQQVTFTATVTDENGDAIDDVTVKWSSENIAVATVAAGVATAIANGTTRITATVGELSGSADLSVQLSDRGILLKLYDMMDGDNWTNSENWGTDSPLEAWYGVETVHDGNDSVYFLDLDENNLGGTIPVDIASLEHLLWIDFVGNRIAGEIPPELGDISTLEVLALGDNELTGQIPSELGGLTELRGLYLGRNDLTGPIPSELRNLNPIIIDLRRNNLSGPLPGDWDLAFLYVSYNPQLTGSLPRALLDLDMVGFRWGETDLCAPVDQEFQDWLDRLLEHFPGDDC